MTVGRRRMIDGRRVLAALLAFTPVACGSSQPVLYGAAQPALPSTAPVQVYAKESDIRQPYKILGIVSASDLGKYQVLTLNDAIPRLQDKARAIGGNALIIDSFQPVKSGIFSTGYSAMARAVLVSGG